MINDPDKVDNVEWLGESTISSLVVQCRECREGELNPHAPFSTADFESAASPSSAISALTDNR